MRVSIVLVLFFHFIINSPRHFAILFKQNNRVMQTSKSIFKLGFIKHQKCHGAEYQFR